MILKKTITSLVVIATLLACTKKHNTIIKSFCYWKTTSNSTINDSLIKQLHLQHLYVRLFDVDWNPYTNSALPVASLHELDFASAKINITPSIFITNNTMLLANKAQLDTLALNISVRITVLLNKFAHDNAQRKGYGLNVDSILAIEKTNLQVNDLLIDCDWSEKSKDNYFYFLTQLQQQTPNYKVSATIRLWQYKYYTKAGVPPVNRGLLMCYNMSSVTDYSTRNSIGTSKELKEYITHSNYTLPLDVALPLFSWSAVFRRGEFKGILSNDIDFKNDTLRFKKTADNNYLLTDDVLIGATYYRNGDEIRIEKITDDELNTMIDVVSNHLQIDAKTKITFFSLDEKYINDYGFKKISNYYARF